MIEDVVSIELPVHERLIINKNRLQPKETNGSEPRVSIVTGTHGDELDGQYVCYEIIRRIQAHPEKLKGIIDIYPDVNPLGLDTGSRGIPMFDLDMNRVFPGDNNGAMAEYVAAGIVNDIIGSDFCLDIHSSNIFVKEAPQVRLNEESADKLLPYAKMLNTDFVWIYSSVTVLEATLAYSLNKLGVPTLVVEMGVGHRISNDYCMQLLDGIFNMLIHLGIWEDEKTEVKSPIMSNEGEVSFLSAKETGVFVSAVKELGTIGFGTHIGDIIDPIQGKIIQRIESPTDGIIFTLRENPVVYKGALIARVYGGRKPVSL
jgi:predicted deacylase